MNWGSSRGTTTLPTPPPLGEVEEILEGQGGDPQEEEGEGHHNTHTHAVEGGGVSTSGARRLTTVTTIVEEEEEDMAVATRTHQEQQTRASAVHQLAQLMSHLSEQQSLLRQLERLEKAAMDQGGLNRGGRAHEGSRTARAPPPIGKKVNYGKVPSHGYFFLQLLEGATEDILVHGTKPRTTHVPQMYKRALGRGKTAAVCRKK